MKRVLALLGLAVLVPACASPDWRRGETTEIVALVVRTEPPGAQVRIRRVDRSWTTPCDIADPQIRRGPLEVTVTLSGFDPVTRRVVWDGESPARVDLQLAAARSLGIIIQGAPPGARVLLLRTPSRAKDPASLVRLWSENEDVQKSALEGLSAPSALLVPMRLSDLAQSKSEAIATLAKAKARDGVDSVQVLHRVTVDGGGGARLANVPPPPGLYLLVTRAGVEDFLVSDLKTDVSGTVTITYPPAEKPAGAVPTLSKLTVKAAGDRVRVTAAGKVVADVPTMPDEAVKLTVPREKVLVEFLDSKTGAVTGSVELAPDGEGGPAPLQPPDQDRLGRIQLVSPKFGIFVRLESGQELSIGEVVVILHDGVEVARAKVLRVCAGDQSYPAGAAMLSPEAASARKGDEARRPKP